MFTVVIQKGWKLMAKRKEQKAKQKQNISVLSAKTVSTGGCYHCCHGYKITNTYEGSHSSHRHLKKHGLFSGRLKIQTVWMQSGPAGSVHRCRFCLTSYFFQQQAQDVQPS